METAEKPVKKKDERKKQANPHAGHRQRKREQFLRQGLDAFADHEALELLLFYAIPQRDTNGLAHLLVDRFGGLGGVLGAPVEELVQVKGMGETAAVLLKLVPAIYQKAMLSLSGEEEILDTTDRQGDYFLNLFAFESEERIYQVCLDAKGRKIRTDKIGVGDVSSVGLNARKIVENALKCGAAQVVLAHNHPSGIAWPSREDRASTAQIRSALEPLGIVLTDHIIVADNDYVSLRLSGLL